MDTGLRITRAYFVVSWSYQSFSVISAIRCFNDGIQGFPGVADTCKINLERESP